MQLATFAGIGATNQEAPPPTTDNRQIVAVVVSYRGRREWMHGIGSVAACLADIVVVDNSDGGTTASLTSKNPIRMHAIANGNVGGLAGAYKVALEWIARQRPSTTHVLFLDEDTHTETLTSFLQSTATVAATSDADVAAVAPMYVDSATNLPGAHIQLGRWRYRILPRNIAEPTEVTFLINSMSLWSVAALRRIGAHDTCLAVDHVDTDYCLRAAALGYRLILNPEVRFPHSIGSRRSYCLFGRVLQAGGHSPERRRLIGRNTAILAKRYGLRWPAFAFLCAARLGYEAMGIIMAENRKLAKLASLASGTFSGLFQHQETMPRPQ